MKTDSKLYTYSLIGLSILAVGGIATFFIFRNKNKSNEVSNEVSNQAGNEVYNQVSVDKSKNYIIGDSQTPLIDRNSQKANRIGEQGGMQNLWEGGKSLSWLKQAVDKYPITADVNSIIINIGTNGGFNASEDVSGLVSSIRLKFPNAKLYAVKGSWGWGGNKNVTQQKVDIYYDKFSKSGVTLIPTPIGVTSNPHNNIPVYATIGREIDSLIK
jgi:hypothetical protein